VKLIWRIFLGIGIYALALCVPFLLENAGELSEYVPDPVKARFERVGSAYQRLTNGPRANEARYTAIVTLNQTDFPDVLNEACKQRAAVAQLIPQLLQARAGEIVIDLAFSSAICPESEDKSATPLLRSALLDAAAQVPVVIGQASLKLAELNQQQADLLHGQDIEEDGLILRPVIDLPLQNPAYQISVGLIRLNEELRKIPLSWSVYEEHSGKLSKKEHQQTLAFAAATFYRAPFPGGADTLTALNNEGRHPLTSLLPMSKFIHIGAAALMCKDASLGVLTVCQGGPPLEVRRKLNGKIVLLGWEDDPRDIHEDRLPGVFLQANFIEALLDSRYLHVVSTKWQILLSILWFGCIELCFQISNGRVEKALAGAIIVFIAGAFLFYYIAVVNLGFYLALLPPSFAVVLLRCWYQLSEHKKGRDGEHDAGEKPDDVGGGADPSPVAGPRQASG
jgi:hypothetical protein